MEQQRIKKTNSMPAEQKSSRRAKTSDIATSFGLMKTITLSLIAGSTVIILFAIYMMNATTVEANERAFFVSEYATATGSSRMTNEQRLVEVRNHIRIFVKHMFEFDQNNFSSNIKYALNMIGNDGKAFYQNYKDTNMLGVLTKNNAQVEIVVDSLKLINDIEPYRYTLYARQTIKTSVGVKQQYLWANVTLIDQSRTDDVPTGLIIDSFDLINNNPVPRAYVEEDLKNEDQVN